MFNNKFSENSAIMESLETLPGLGMAPHDSNLQISNDFKSIDVCTPVAKFELPDNSTEHSFLLMDAEENLRVTTPESFCKKLKCKEDTKIKVISIFGNTGDGKSHTINHTFFHGAEIFKTSQDQNFCTIGVYAALQRNMDVLCLDTEGLLGTTKNNHRRMRMLLKILAISDIVIYRIRSERLRSDMFEFLGSASNAFCSHFAQVLQSLPGQAQTLGPAVIIFHETQHTKPLNGSVVESVEDQIRKHFERHNHKINAFSSLRYIGIQTEKQEATDYGKLKAAIKMEIENTTVRSPRQPSAVFKALNALNTKFSGDIEDKSSDPFPEQSLTCSARCEACNQRCQRSMGHLSDGESHMNQKPCNYQNQYDNKKYLCKLCYNNGKESIVTFSTQTKNDSSWSGLAKYAWKGGVIDCPSCGEIYRSRQYWFGNKSPEETSVRSIIVHVWESKGLPYSAQMVFDTVSTLSDALPKFNPNSVTGWLADWVAPSYWKPNSEIISCYSCKKNFEKTGLHKHHCRGCGEGFCHACSLKKLPVPARGWTEPVRVCDACYTLLLKHPNKMPGQQTNEQADVTARKIGEVLINPLNSLTLGAYAYTKGFIKETVRPEYWIPDEEAPNCMICDNPFGTAEEIVIAKTKAMAVGGSTTLSAANSAASPAKPSLNQTQANIVNGNMMNASCSSNISSVSSNISPSLGDCYRHHCRRCGFAICGYCSKGREPVLEHGWDYPVRICDKCAELKQSDAANNGQLATEESGSRNHIGATKIGGYIH